MNLFLNIKLDKKAIYTWVINSNAFKQNKIFLFLEKFDWCVKLQASCEFIWLRMAEIKKPTKYLTLEINVKFSTFGMKI